MSVNVGLGTSSCGLPASCRISARANVVFPLPRSPERATTSPGFRIAARSIASWRVAFSSCNTRSDSLGRAIVVSIGRTVPSRGRHVPHRLIDWKRACHGGAAALDGFEAHRSTVQLDERAYDGQAKPSAATLGSERMALESVEYAI